MTDLITDPNPGITPDNGSVIRTDQHNEIISRLEGTASTKIRIGAILIDATLNVGAQSITTTSYTVKEITSDYTGLPTLQVAPTSGNIDGGIEVKPSGISTVSELDLYNSSDDTDYAALYMRSGQYYARIGTEAAGAAIEPYLVLGSGSKYWYLGTDGSLTLPGPLNTTNYTISEAISDYSGTPVIMTAQTTGDAQSYAAVRPVGTQQFSGFFAFNGPDITTDYEMVELTMGPAGAYISMNKGGTGTVRPFSIFAGLSSTVFGTDGSVSLSGALKTANVTLEQSTSSTYISNTPTILVHQTNSNVGVISAAPDIYYNTGVGILEVYNSGDILNSSYGTLFVDTNGVFIGSSSTGTGTTLPLAINVGSHGWTFATDGSLTLASSGALKTTNYSIQEATDGSRQAIYIQPNNGDRRGMLEIAPSGTDTSSQLVLYGESALLGTEFWQIQEFTGGVSEFVVSADLFDDYTFEIDGNAGAKVWRYKQDGSMILPGNDGYSLLDLGSAVGALKLQPTIADKQSGLYIVPSGNQTAAQFALFSTSDIDNGDGCQLIMYTGPTGAQLNLNALNAGSVSNGFVMTVGSKMWWLKADGSLTLPGALSLGTDSGIVAASASVAPTTSNIPDGQYTVWNNTGNDSTKLYYNDGGSLKNVELTSIGGANTFVLLYSNDDVIADTLHYNSGAGYNQATITKSFVLPDNTYDKIIVVADVGINPNTTKLNDANFFIENSANFPSAMQGITLRSQAGAQFYQYATMRASFLQQTTSTLAVSVNASLEEDEACSVLVYGFHVYGANLT